MKGGRLGISDPQADPKCAGVGGNDNRDAVPDGFLFQFKFPELQSSLREPNISSRRSSARLANAKQDISVTVKTLPVANNRTLIIELIIAPPAFLLSACNFLFKAPQLCRRKRVLRPS